MVDRVGSALVAWYLLKDGLPPAPNFFQGLQGFQKALKLAHARCIRTRDLLPNPSEAVVNATGGGRTCLPIQLFLVASNSGVRPHRCRMRLTRLLPHINC